MHDHRPHPSDRAGRREDECAGLGPAPGPVWCALPRGRRHRDAQRRRALDPGRPRPDDRHGALDPQRLRARLRRVHAPGRTLGRPVRPPPRLPARARGVRRVLRARWARRPRLPAGAGPVRHRGVGRLHGAGRAQHHHHQFRRGTAPGPGGGDLRRDRRGGVHPRHGRRRAADQRELALGVLRARRRRCAAVRRGPGADPPGRATARGDRTFRPPGCRDGHRRHVRGDLRTGRAGRGARRTAWDGRAAVGVGAAPGLHPHRATLRGTARPPRHPAQLTARPHQRGRTPLHGSVLRVPARAHPLPAGPARLVTPGDRADLRDHGHRPDPGSRADAAAGTPVGQRAR